MSNTLKPKVTNIISTPPSANPDSETVQLTLRPTKALLEMLEEEAKIGGFRSVQQLILAILRARALSRIGIK